MISLQDCIKYIGLAAIIYFLIKAFADNLLSNKQIGILVLCIIIIVIFIVNQQLSCTKIEKFDSNNNSAQLVSNNENNITRQDMDDEDTNDDDMDNLKDILGVDDQKYQNIIQKENDAMNKIRSNHQYEMVYTNTHPFNTIPLGSQIYGYTYLPPENWYRAYERPPVCITNKQNNVYPAPNASISGLMEFDSDNNLSNINTNYVNKVLNRNDHNNNQIN